jgi:hypothetical protein
MVIDKHSLCEKLINSYPDSIIEEDGEIDFENTVYNFADNVMNDLKEFKSRKKFFGCDFANVDECYRWILNELGELYEMCFNFINNEYE